MGGRLSPIAAKLFALFAISAANPRDRYGIMIDIGRMQHAGASTETLPKPEYTPTRRNPRGEGGQMRRRVARERPPQRKAVQKAPEGAPYLQPLLRCDGAGRILLDPVFDQNMREALKSPWSWTEKRAKASP